MIDGYIVEGKKLLRIDDTLDIFTSDTVFENLSDAINESRKIYKKLLKSIKKDYKTYYNKEDDSLEENFFVDEKNEQWYNSPIGSFSIVDINGHFAEGFLKKVTIKLDNKKTEKDNNG